MRILAGPIVAIAMLAGDIAVADTISTRSRDRLFASQLGVLDGRAADQYNTSDRLQPPRVVVPAAATAPVPAYVGRYAGPYLALARAAAQRHSIPEDLFLRLVQQESGWNAQAVSTAGALGLAQLMPGTARVLGVDPTEPAQNLDGGARYLREQYNAFGTWRLALAAYNAGPGAVQQYGGIPPYAETQHYVAVILGN